jgi:hypothetical protein
MASKHQFQFTRAGKLHFFCPLCHYHQSTNTIEKMMARHHLSLIVLTLTISYLAWPLFGWKGLSLYFFFWGVFEVAYRMRKRQALVCESCGFDPFLYKQDVHKARKALRKHWEQRIEAENLFEGLKLKNYTTKAINKKDSAATTSAILNSENKKPNGVSTTPSS